MGAHGLIRRFDFGWQISRVKFKRECKHLLVCPVLDFLRWEIHQLISRLAWKQYDVTLWGVTLNTLPQSHTAATNRTMRLGSPPGSCGLDKVDQFASVTLHIQESCWMYSTSSLSSTAVGLPLDHKREMIVIISEAAIMLLDCLFFPSCRHIVTNLEPPPQEKKQKTQPSNHVAVTRRELVRRGWGKEGWTEKDRRWGKKEGQDEWRQKYKVTVRQRGWRDF